MILVLLGAGIEYSLAPLAEEARRRGFTAIEVDMYKPDWRAKMDQTHPKKFTLVTSYHPFIDSWFHNKEFGTNLDMEALPAFIHRYQPGRTYFIPHDLTEPFKDDEIGALSKFDALFMPDGHHWYLGQYTAVYTVGWIKFASTTSLPIRELSFLPSELPYYIRHGRASFLRAFEPVLQLKPRIKLQPFPGIEEIEKVIGDFGCEVLPRDADGGAILKSSKIMISNGISSVNLEMALLGVTGFCVEDGVHPKEEQIRHFGRIPNIGIGSAQEVQRLVKEALDGDDLVVAPNQVTFDFDLVFEVITGAAAPR